MNLEWSNTARSNLDSIRRYVSERSSSRTQRLVSSIVKRCEQIAAFPHSGHVVTELDYPQIRQVIVEQYRVVYHLAPDKITIVAIVHSAQNWPGPGIGRRNDA
jgi:toxin ParE1/3/4